VLHGENNYPELCFTCASRIRLPFFENPSIKYYRENSYQYIDFGPYAKRAPYFYFNKKNISKVYHINKKEKIKGLLLKRRKTILTTLNPNFEYENISSFYITNPKKILCIEFKKPLKFLFQKILFKLPNEKLPKLPDLKKIYFSVKNPEMLIKDLK